MQMEEERASLPALACQPDAVTLRSKSPSLFEKSGITLNPGAKAQLADPNFLRE